MYISYTSTVYRNAYITNGVVRSPIALQFSRAGLAFPVAHSEVCLHCRLPMRTGRPSALFALILSVCSPPLLSGISRNEAVTRVCLFSFDFHLFLTRRYNCFQHFFPPAVLASLMMSCLLVCPRRVPIRAPPPPTPSAMVYPGRASFSASAVLPAFVQRHVLMIAYWFIYPACAMKTGQCDSVYNVHGLWPGPRRHRQRLRVTTTVTGGGCTVRPGQPFCFECVLCSSVLIARILFRTKELKMPVLLSLVKSASILTHRSLVHLPFLVTQQPY